MTWEANDNRDALDAHYPDPTVADDEWQDCPEDDAYVWTDEDERQFRESEHLDAWKDER